MLLLQQNKLKEILRSFYTLTSVRIAVLDEWYNEIAAFPENMCALCTRLRMDEEIDRICRNSDQNAFLIVKKTGKQYTYRCPMGLYESVYPIIMQGVNMGFLMIGQFIESSTKQTFMRTICEKCGDKEQVRKEIEQVRVLDSKAVPCIASIMTVCAEYLCFSKTIFSKDAGRAEKIRAYVNEHIDETISVQQLADYFHMSRTSFYLFMKKSFGKGVTEYVNEQKINAAKKMLDEGLKTEMILEKLNFSDANYFRRLFKKYAGISIRKYKQKI